VITDKEKIVDIVKIAGFVVAYPKPRRPKIPPDNPKALFKDLLKRLVCWTYLGF
jgi:hypothetical protein